MGETASTIPGTGEVAHVTGWKVAFITGRGQWQSCARFRRITDQLLPGKKGRPVTSRPAPEAASRLQMWTMYLGGFIGPFAGQSLAVILPVVAGTFAISLEQAALTMSVYLVPFATVMLVSTRLVRSLRPRRVILTAYAVTIPCTLVVILTPYWWLFAVAFALMGIANAFTMPVFQVMIRQLVPPARLGSALGTYAAMQSFGMLFAPVVAGLAAAVHWQLMFLVVFVAAVWVVLVGLPDTPPPVLADRQMSGRIRWGATVVHMLTCLAIGLGLIGAGMLVALIVGERFGLDPFGRGLVVMCGGLSAFFLSRRIGKLADARGPRPVLLGSLLAGAAAMAFIPVAPMVWLVAVCWALAILAAQGLQMTVNLIVLGSPGGSSLLSSVQAFRFYGAALTPLVVLPVFLESHHLAFWSISAGLLVILGLQAWAGARARG